ncbi:hypothetical protein [Microbacterium testaceum]|uniref:hypothetical protein n=1 Tax=Microbacterium testaceum TaxID=2033 RepID=UPI002AC5DBE0|nr:hypothetical protein [Microbacterium testaceum]MDZ5146332.1 hypothetical protein [Microbacterium testaceum]
MAYDEFNGRVEGTPATMVASRTSTRRRPGTAIQDWFRGRPRLRYAVRMVAAVIWALIYVGAHTVIAGILGAICAALLIVFVNLASPVDAGAIDVVQSNWGGLVTLAAVFAAGGGLMWILLRGLRLTGEDQRPRDVIARDLVAQGLVAAALGYTRVQIRLGIVGSGSLQYSYVGPLDAVGEVERRFSNLTIQMVNPSLGSSIEHGGERQRHSWFAEISTTASDVMIRAAAAGLNPEGEAALIARAAR